MATNRTRRSRQIVRPFLSEPMRFFLETGQYCGLRKRFPDITSFDRVEIFRLANPSLSMRERLRAVWLLHQAEILADWKKSKKKGQPWASKEFENNAHQGRFI